MASDPRTALELGIQATKAELQADAEALQSGSINAPEFFIRASAKVKRLTIASGTVGAGGKARLTPSTYGRLGARVKAQLAYLDGFARDVEAERIDPKSDAFTARVNLYAESAIGTYEAMARRRAMDDGEFSEERRVMDPASDHCQQCIDEAAKGWQEPGVLKDIGYCTCIVRCRCTFQRR